MPVTVVKMSCFLQNEKSMEGNKNIYSCNKIQPICNKYLQGCRLDIETILLQHDETISANMSEH